MRNKSILLVVVLLFAAASIGILLLRAEKPPVPSAADATNTAVVHEPSSAPTTAHVPAYQSPEQARRLGPTLEPAEFFGKTREAYQVAKKIPMTLAQLPCYCHCDKSFGHKSLHTCFEDDHASHCAVCVDEALLAYELQTREKLTPNQVRDIIIRKYSEAGHSDHH